MADPEGSTLAPGTRVGDRFVLERLLRREVVTEVYLARGEGGGTARYEVRRVLAAAPPPGAEPVLRRELERVAAAGCRVIPAVVAVVPDPAGILVVTEAPEALTPRETLREIVARGEALPARDALRVLREAARALDALHALAPQVLHRAVCPENISLMERRQRVWLTESGLAHALVAAGVVPARTPMVASAYRSPDEILQRATPRGDVFALASVAFEAITGRPAFLASTEAATESAMLRGPRPTVGQSVAVRGDRVDAALHRAWSVEAEGGYAKASEFVAALDRAMDGTAEAEPPLSSRTIIGLGVPSLKGGSARPTLPRAPVSPEPAGEGSRSSPRALPPTQKVQVPNIHPPGTEPVAQDVPREDREKPLVLSPPRAPAAKVVPPPAERPKVEPPPSVAAALGPRLTRAPGEVPPDQFEITKPVRIDPPPEAKGDIVAERRGATSEATSARDSWEEVLHDALPPTEKTTVRAPSGGTEEVPTRPPPLPPVGVPTIAPTGAEEDGELEVDALEVAPEPVSRPSLPPVSRPPPPPAAARISHTSLPPVTRSAAPPERPSTPSLPAEATSSAPPPPTPSAPPVASQPPSLAVESADNEEDLASEAPTITPPRPEPVERPIFETPVPPPPIAPPLEDARELAAAPEVAAAPLPSPVPGAWVPPPSAPAPSQAPIARPAPTTAAPSGRRPFGRVLVGLVALAAGAGLYWQTHIRQTAPLTETPPRGAMVDAQAVIDAAAAATVDARAEVRVAAPADVIVAEDRAAPSDAVTTAQDAHAPAADVVMVDAGALAAAPPSVAVADAGATAGLAPPIMRESPPRGHPRGRETVALEDAMFDEVMACVGQRHRRKVRVAVTYLGATGLADRIRVAAPYNEPETLPCIEGVIRRHPVGRFSDAEWETGFVFDPEDR